MRISGFLARLLTVAGILCGSLAPAFAQHDAEALTELSLDQLLNLEIRPVNVLGAHTHFEGQWMFGYQVITKVMRGQRDGTDRVSHRDVLRDFRSVHTKMSMATHLWQVMYAPSDGALPEWIAIRSAVTSDQSKREPSASRVIVTRPAAA